MYIRLVTEVRSFSVFTHSTILNTGTIKALYIYYNLGNMDVPGSYMCIWGFEKIYSTFGQWNLCKSILPVVNEIYANIFYHWSIKFIQIYSTIGQWNLCKSILPLVNEIYANLFYHWSIKFMQIYFTIGQSNLCKSILPLVN